MYKGICKFCNKVFDPNRRTVISKDPKIWWCSFDCHSQDLIKEKKQPKRDVKLPELGKRYRNKIGGAICWIIPIANCTNNVRMCFENVGILNNTYKDCEDFWDHFEELPEDSIEPESIEELKQLLDLKNMDIVALEEINICLKREIEELKKLEGK